MHGMKHAAPKLVGGALAAVLALAAGPAGAASTGGTLTAKLTIMSNCNVNATSQVNFGAVDPTQPRDTAGAGSLSVVCTKGTTIVSVVLGRGANYDGGSRRMADGSGDYIAYALYTDNAHTLLWGDGVTSGLGRPLGSGFFPSTSASAAQVFKVYGLVAAASLDVPADTYDDTIDITVNF